MTTHLSRRTFLAASALAGTARGLRARQVGPPAQTAQQVIDRIRSAFGPTWRVTPTDAIHAGSPDAEITGIATTVMSTYDVLRRAAQANRNLVITHEPTFYTGSDNVSGLLDDPMYLRKLDFIKANNLVVFRFHDNWHARRPEPMSQGLAEALGWGQMRLADEPDVFAIPATSFQTIATLVQSRLGVRSYRTIGQADTRVTRVGFLPGTPPSATAMARLLPRVDLVIAGEQREWEGIYYAQDTVAAGEQKAVLVLGHAISEDPGMKLCADWLKTVITDLPVEWIRAGEPFSRAEK